MMYRGLNRLSEPAVLFPVTAVFLLALIWAATIGFIRLRYSQAEHVAAISSRELRDTYEAQVVRALSEIDTTLNLVKYWHESVPGKGMLAALKANGLLPPDLLFTVSVADRHGVIIDSTRPLQGKNVGDDDYFRMQRGSATFFIGQPAQGTGGDSQLHFSHRLDAANGAFDGVVIVGVAAAYFVSGYEPAKFGEHGVLGIVGTDGVVRVRRTGEAESSGDIIDYASVIPRPETAEFGAAISTNSWDGVRRWTSARELYGFPLAVLVGLSVDEQLAVAHRASITFVWGAVGGSILVMVLTALLGRMSWQLGQSRLRESETKIAHADRVEHLAYHDGLTGLPNRSMFSKLLSQSISEARRYDRRLAVAFLDLDRFKQINDTLGHDAGDQLLREVAIRLKACVRESGVVARLGGDEFVVLLPESNDDKFAATVAQKILSIIAKPFTLIGHEFRVTASIGISAYPRDGLDEQTLTKNADIAMYQAKAEGKNNFRLYSEKLNANSLERLTLESSLRHALERNEFRLYYQSKRDIGSGRITGTEALLRWEHPDLGLVAPMQFIPIAEETGLIVPIGRWVLKTACLQNVAWQKAGVPPLSIAVNLTARQFSDEHLLEDVVSVLEDTGMDAGLLEIEINEGLLTHNIEATLKVLTRLKSLGIRIAIDDFGTGYTTLATLQRFPLDTIKIDRSLIKGIAAGGENTGLTDAVIAMGKNLSLTVVAQGVETSEQAEFLRVHACDELQGFYFNRPLPPEEFAKLLLAQTAEVTYFGERLGVRAG
jgi:diguanylate cyclase (GGDEF)-like protein